MEWYSPGRGGGAAVAVLEAGWVLGWVTAEGTGFPARKETPIAKASQTTVPIAPRQRLMSYPTAKQSRCFPR